MEEAPRALSVSVLWWAPPDNQRHEEKDLRGAPQGSSSQRGNRPSRSTPKEALDTVITLLTIIVITQVARILQEERRWKHDQKLYMDGLREAARKELERWEPKT
jgi:hypothetical protein